MKEKSEENSQAKYVDNSKYSFAHLVNGGFRHKKFEIYLKKGVDGRVASPHHFCMVAMEDGRKTGKDRKMACIEIEVKRLAGPEVDRTLRWVSADGQGEYLYLLLCSWPHHETCTWSRQPQAYVTAEACYREGARRVEANRASVTGHFIFIECRGA